jgi:hypothetical protein
MIREFDIRRRGDTILVGIALDHAVLDFESTEASLRECLAFLDAPHKGLVDKGIGKFGQFPVTLSMHHDDTLSIFVDGPSFEPQRELCAAIWLSKDDLRSVITAALSNAEPGASLASGGH